MIGILQVIGFDSKNYFWIDIYGIITEILIFKHTRHSNYSFTHHDIKNTITLDALLM